MSETKNKVHSGEWQAVILSFVYFFCVLSSYYVIRPIREQLVANPDVGSGKLPSLFAATFVATLVLTPVFAWAASRWPRRVFVPVTYVVFIVCMLSFLPFFNNPQLVSPRTLAIVFFVWVSVFNLFVVSVFWSFMSDIWNQEQARRLYVVIALGGTAGAITGPIMTKYLVGLIGVAPLLIVSSALLGAALFCIFALNRWASQHGLQRHQGGNDAPVGGGMFDGLKQIFAVPFMRNMAILMVLSDMIGTVGYVLMTDYSGATFGADAVARTEFAAKVDAITNISQVIIQLTLTNFLLRTKGPAFVLVVCAIMSVLVCIAVALSRDAYAPVVLGLPWVIIMVITIRALAYGMRQPAGETLYTQVPREWRYKGKNAVDTAVWRAGDVACTLAMKGLQSMGATVAAFGWISAGVMIVMGGLGWRVAKQAQSQGQNVQ